jgi:hypothetical protein
VRQLDPIVAREGQTVFPIAGGYDPGALIVTVNGVIIQPSDFTADGQTITLVAGLRADDEVGAVVF